MTEQNSEQLPGRTPHSLSDVRRSKKDGRSSEGIDRTPRVAGSAAGDVTTTPEVTRAESEVTMPASEPQQAATGVKSTRKERARGHRLEHAFRKFREGPGREAQDLYRDVVAETPTPLVEHVDRGVRYDESGHPDLAIEEFSAALKLDPDSAPVMANLAAAYASVGRFGEAEVAIQRALSLEPESVEARASQGILAFRRGLYAEAEFRLKAVCECDSAHGPAHFYRGEALNRLGRVDEALRVAERTIELQPRNWRAYLTLGMLLDRTDDEERALEMYRRASELNDT